jgi:hypothetical protein
MITVKMYWIEQVGSRSLPGGISTDKKEYEFIFSYTLFSQYAAPPKDRYAPLLAFTANSVPDSRTQRA